MLPHLETLKQMGALALTAVGVACMLRAVFILLFRTPARATLVYDGYRKMCSARNSAVILHERAPMPYTVEDVIAFTTARGQKMRVPVRRYAQAHDQLLVVWYSPDRPEKVSTTGPVTWFVRFLACFGTLILLT